MAPQVKKAKTAFLYYQSDQLSAVRKELGLSMGDAMTEVSTLFSVCTCTHTHTRTRTYTRTFRKSLPHTCFHLLTTPLLSTPPSWQLVGDP